MSTQISIKHHGSEHDGPLVVAEFETDADGAATGEPVRLQEVASGVSVLVDLRPGHVVALLRGRR